VVREAMRRGLAGREVRWLPRELATEGWALESRGHVQCAALDHAANPAPHSPDPSLLAAA
jgi:hypothetical protein